MSIPTINNSTTVLNDIDELHLSVTNSTLEVFADYMTVYQVVANVSDSQLLQDDLSCLYD